MKLVDKKKLKFNETKKLSSRSNLMGYFGSEGIYDSNLSF